MPGELLIVGLFCLFGLAVVGIISLSYLQGMRNFTEALANGIHTEAAVERKFGRHYVRIGFHDLTGRRYEVTKRILPSEFHRLQEGSATQIVYLPRNPNIWFFADDIRRAQELRK